VGSSVSERVGAILQVSSRGSQEKSEQKGHPFSVGKKK